MGRRPFLGEGEWRIAVRLSRGVREQVETAVERRQAAEFYSISSFVRDAILEKLEREKIP